MLRNKGWHSVHVWVRSRLHKNSAQLPRYLTPLSHVMAPQALAKQISQNGAKTNFIETWCQNAQSHATKAWRSSAGVVSWLEQVVAFKLLFATLVLQHHSQRGQPRYAITFIHQFLRGYQLALINKQCVCGAESNGGIRGQLGGSTQHIWNCWCW